MKDETIRRCPVCKKQLVGSTECRKHAIKEEHWGIYLDYHSKFGLSIG